MVSYYAVARVLARRWVSQRSAVTLCGVWREHRNKNVRPKNAHLGQKRSAITLAYFIIVFFFVASSIEKRARASGRGYGTKPTLGGPRMCDGVWRGNLGLFLRSKYVIFYCDQIPMDCNVATTRPDVFYV